MQVGILNFIDSGIIRLDATGVESGRARQDKLTDRQGGGLSTFASKCNKTHCAAVASLQHFYLWEINDDECS